MSAHAATTDIQDRLRDYIQAWGELKAPEAHVEVRADTVTAAFAEIDRLRNLRADMLAALKACVRMYGEPDGDDWSCIEKARAVIAKATGN